MGYRVVQWAAGNVGQHAIREIADHPELELVGVLVTSPSKVGKDAGELAGLGRSLGVVATDDPDAIEALDADCVCYAPSPAALVNDDPDADTKTICRLLSSGKNVVTSVGYVYPAAYGGDLVERLEKACAEGGVSVHGTGANPGFMSDVLPLTLSGLCEQIESVRVVESSEFSWYESPTVVFDMLGMGKTPDDYDSHTERYRTWLSGLFVESVHLVADGLGNPVDRVETTSQIVLAEDDLPLAAGLVARGTVAGQRWAWTGVVGSTPFVSLETYWRAHPAVEPTWPKLGGLLHIEGTPIIKLDLGDWISDGLLATAAHAVHSIPHVVRAETGIRTFLDLPLIVGRASRPASGDAPAEHRS